MKRNFYLVQAGCLYGNTYYLPYAVGMLAAFALQEPSIHDAFTCKRIIYSLEDIDKSIDSLEDPAFIGFSNSIWNYNYNLVYAEKVKQRFPNCVIEFGGHHVPPTTEYLDRYPFIDVLIYRKGEEAFRDVLLSMLGKKFLCDIPNIAYRTSDGTAVQTPYEKITISDYPSPYLMGVFDEILQNGEYPFSCVLETNRGCPYDCCYCDWGELNSKVRLFPLEKVFAELSWMAAHKIEFVYCVDANFGMFERDMRIAEKLVELKETFGYPNRLQVSYAKNEPERVFHINRLLASHGIGKGATLALQSLSDEVLRNIGRSNISKEEYMRQIARYREHGISTYTELILGLPGETLDSFCRGLCQLLEWGQHSSVSAYYCELLPNSRLSEPQTMQKFQIQTISTALNQYHCQKMDDVLSGKSSIVVGTYSMSTQDWIEANLFSVFVQSLHHFGLMQCAAMYVRMECGISYFDFYSALYHFIQTETVLCRSFFDTVSETLHRFVDGKGGLTYQNDVFGPITYPLEEAVFLLCLYHEPTFYEEMTAFLRRYIDDEQLLRSLTDYQRAVILKPGKPKFSAAFDYDFYDYFDAVLVNSHRPLVQKSVRYAFSSPFCTKDWEEYAKEIIWYGRRNCRMMFSSAPNKIEAELELG
ncbi:MAG: B12-binding domain-containing radical SAM protein [Acutalibacteraceae bacterium]